MTQDPTTAGFSTLALDSLLDQLGPGVAITDKQGIVTHWSRSAEKLLKYPRERAIGTHAVMLSVPDRDRTQAQERLNVLLVEGKSWEDEFPITDAAGHRLLIRFRARPMFGQDGSITGCIALFGESSMMRADEAAVSLMDTLFLDAPLGIAILDPDLRFVRLNAAGNVLTGGASRGMLGLDVHSVLGSAGAGLAGVARQVLRTGVPVINRDQWIGTGSERRCLRCSFFRLGSDLQVVGTALVFTDVTGDKAAERTAHRLEQRRSVLQETARLVTLGRDALEVLARVTDSTVSAFNSSVELHAAFGTGQALQMADADRRHVRLLPKPGPAATADHPATHVVSRGVPFLTDHVVAVPVKMLNTTYGVLTARRDPTGPAYDGVDIADLTTVAALLAPAFVVSLGAE